MNKTLSRTCWTMAAGLVAAFLVVGSAQADKPSSAGAGKPAKTKPGKGGGAHFSERERTTIRTYFGEQVRAGHCPPGLARKNNGCMPPGQAKKWRVGRPLPRDVIFYDLPPRLIVDLGPPPAGYKFVRVAEDILLIAIGTGMVLDAVEDIGWTLDR